MAFGDGKLIGGPKSGPRPEVVVCEPIPIPPSGVMTCRRGQGQRTFQGQKPPVCDGVVELAVQDDLLSLCCNMCRLRHEKLVVRDVLHYGSVL